MSELVSIIIPVYKAAQYLDACMSSVLSQDYSSIEVILVDDGSPDECPGLCDEYAKKYDNVKSVHRENGGLWAARNTGLENATGKYIFFLDSDDLLDSEKAISLLVETAEKENAEITVGAYRRLLENVKSGVNHHCLGEIKDINSAKFRFDGFYRHGHLSYNWGKLYSREFLMTNDLWLKSFPYTQDKYHNLTCYAMNPRYAFTEESVYLYRVNDGSVTFKYKNNFIDVWTSIATSFRDFLKERNITGDYNDLLAFHIFYGSFFLLKQEHGHAEKKKVKAGAKKLKEYANVPIVSEMMGYLAKGKYIHEIEYGVGGVIINVAAWLFTHKKYGIYSLGVRILQRMSVDKKITASRYKEA